MQTRKSVQRILQCAVSCVSIRDVTATSARAWTVISWRQTGVIALWRHRSGKRGSLSQHCSFTLSPAESLVGVCGLAAAVSWSIAQLDSCRH